MENLTRRLNRSVEPVDDLAGAVEAMGLALVSRAAGWAASVPNMIMVARSAVRVFEIGPGLGYAIAVALELIGQSLVAHWNRCKRWNAGRRKTDPGVNERLALGLMAVYFVMDVAMVGVLALVQFLETGEGQIFLALCYPLIGVVSAIVTNERAALFRVEKAREFERADAARARKTRTSSGIRKEGGSGGGNVAGSFAGSGPEAAWSTGGKTRERAAAILAERSGISGAELGRLLGRSERLGRMLKAEIAGDGNGRG